MKTGSGKARNSGARFLAQRRVRLVADHQLVGGRLDLGMVAREPGIGLNRDRVRLADAVPAQDHVRETLGIPGLGEIVAELTHEQAPVSEDEHADGSRRLDEAGRRDRLARGGWMTETKTADRARILHRRQFR